MRIEAEDGLVLPSVSALAGMLLVKAITSGQSSTSSAEAFITWLRPALVEEGVSSTSAFWVEKRKSQVYSQLRHLEKTYQNPAHNRTSKQLSHINYRTSH